MKIETNVHNKDRQVRQMEKEWKWKETQTKWGLIRTLNN